MSETRQKPLFMDDQMSRWAGWSDDKAYRYVLGRTWEHELPKVMFIGLNPSIADEIVDDATIKVCIAFARRWGYGGLLMLNLFTLVSTDPRALDKHHDPIGGPDADRQLLKYADECQLIVAAWGSDKAIGTRAGEVLTLLNRKVHCLIKNQDGSPHHPLYVSLATKPQVFYNP